MAAMVTAARNAKVRVKAKVKQARKAATKAVALVLLRMKDRSKSIQRKRAREMLREHKPLFGADGLYIVQHAHSRKSNLFLLIPF